MTVPLTTQDWEEIHRTKQWGTWPPEAFVAFMATAYPEPASFIEIGCGAGAQLRYIAATGHTAIGIDASASAIARCRSLAFKAQGRIALMAADVREFEPEGRVDCVIDVCTLQHLSLTATAAVLGKVRRKWLVPGGKLFTMMVNDAMGVDIMDARKTSAAGIASLFADWQVDVSRSQVTFNDGSFISHWIVVGSPK